MNDDFESTLPEEASRLLAHLSPEERDELIACCAEAAREKDERLERAFSRALDVVPFPLRGIVRKALFG